jgi:hypothetical protein
MIGFVVTADNDVFGVALFVHKCMKIADAAAAAAAGNSLDEVES